MTPDLSQDHRLDEYRLIWESKPVLREIYHDYYRRIAALMVPGRSLEIGGGSGNLKRYAENVVSTDILPGRWLDALADAQRLPFADRSFDNIVMVDVLHHIEHPAAFFDEAGRVLRDGGRIVMVEPAITPGSALFYKRFHPEPVDMLVDPLAPPRHTGPKDPFDSNQAVPTLLFGRHREAFQRRFPSLEVTHRQHLSLVAYPLSGGFRPWSAVSHRAAVRLLALEGRLGDRATRLLGFRLLVALTHRQPT
jgi:SAM-dependent methyltransferase